MGNYSIANEFLLLICILILPLISSFMVSSTFRKYSRVNNSRNLTGAQVARMILDSNGLYNVRVEPISGNLTDHYSPKENVVRLSDSVYGKTSVVAIGVAAHECGHACQHSENYAPVVIRTQIVPIVNICSRFWYVTFILGCLIAAFRPLIYVGIAMLFGVVLFQLVTLPTELDASHRALKTLDADGILESSEIPLARKVLTAAAMTYVTALLASIMQFLRFAMRARR